MKRSILAVLMMSAYAFRMADDAPAATNDAADGATASAEPTTPAAVTVTVPAEHADLLQRAIALLEKGETYVKDNIEEGIAMLEGLFKSSDTTATPAADAPTTDTAPPAA